MPRFDAARRRLRQERLVGHVRLRFDDGDVGRAARQASLQAERGVHPDVPAAHDQNPCRAHASNASERLGPGEHRIEHVFGQSPGEGVLLAHVVAAQHGAAVDRHLDAVPERRDARRQRHAGRPQGRPQRGPAEAAEHDDHPQPRPQQLHLARQPRPAGVALLRCRLVRRRGAPHRRGDVDVVEAQPVVGRDRGRLVRQAGPVQRRIEPVAAAVAGEHPAGAVRAVRRGRQTDDQDLRRRIAEARHRSSPIGLVGEGAAPLQRDLLAPGNQPRAGSALAHPARRSPGALAAVCASRATSAPSRATGTRVVTRDSLG